VLQLIIGMLIVFTYLLVILRANPMLHHKNNSFNAFVAIQLLITVWAGMFIRLEDGSVSASYVFGYSEEVVLVALFIANIGVLAVGVAFLAQDLSSDTQAAVMRFARSREPVRLPKLPHGQYHLFLSHAQKYGADQVAVIKYRLERVVQGAQFFLDVDTLRGTSQAGEISLKNLPGIVKNSQALLIFLTDECFTQWVKNEIETAVTASTGIIPVLETDSRHGGVSIADMKNQCPAELSPVLFKEPPIKWVRDSHVKNISLKKIAQRLLVIMEPAQYRSDPPPLTITGEIESAHFGPLPLPATAESHVYITRGGGSLDVVIGLEGMFNQRNIPFVISKTGLGEASEAERTDAISKSCSVIATLNQECIIDAQVQSDLRIAQKLGVPITVLHIRQADDGPMDSTVASIIEMCPTDISSELFSELCVEWHLDPEYSGVSQQMVWQRLAALGNSAALDSSSSSSSSSSSGPALSMASDARQRLAALQKSAALGRSPVVAPLTCKELSCTAGDQITVF
jgi:hypothetical protein